METHIWDIEGIGQVTVTRRKGTSRISIRVRPDESVIVYYPWFVSQKEVQKFLLQQHEWIAAHKKKMAGKRVYYSANTNLTTKKHTISILPVNDGKLQAGIKGFHVVITIPKNMEEKSDQVQHFIRKVLGEVCRKEAREHLPLRVQELASKYGFSYQKVFIKKLKSKWGSCSSTGNINLNVSLMLLPDYLIDYIILHELAHTREPNHGPGFWKLLNSITNNSAKEYDKEIRKRYRVI